MSTIYSPWPEDSAILMYSQQQENIPILRAELVAVCTGQPLARTTIPRANLRAILPPTVHRNYAVIIIDERVIALYRAAHAGMDIANLPPLPASAATRDQTTQYPRRAQLLCGANLSDGSFVVGGFGGIWKLNIHATPSPTWTQVLDLPSSTISAMSATSADTVLAIVQGAAAGVWCVGCQAHITRAAEDDEGSPITDIPPGRIPGSAEAAPATLAVLPDDTAVMTTDNDALIRLAKTQPGHESDAQQWRLCAQATLPRAMSKVIPAGPGQVILQPCLGRNVSLWEVPVGAMSPMHESSVVRLAGGLVAVGAIVAPLSPHALVGAHKVGMGRFGLYVLDQCTGKWFPREWPGPIPMHAPVEILCLPSASNAALLHSSAPLSRPDMTGATAMSLSTGSVATFGMASDASATLSIGNELSDSTVPESNWERLRRVLDMPGKLQRHWYIFSQRWRQAHSAGVTHVRTCYFPAHLSSYCD